MRSLHTQAAERHCLYRTALPGILVLLASLAYFLSARKVAAADEDFVGPYPSWINVRSAPYSAKGDGIADDTAALQAALNATDGVRSTVYLPAGTYKISATLYWRAKQNVALIGENPATTIVAWHGAAGGTMHWADGVMLASWARITWDGRGVAAVGVAHIWDRTHLYSTTFMTHHDEVFKNLRRGFVAGKRGDPYGVNDADGSIVRCKFINNSEAGVSVECQNALDWGIWDSEFVNNARGATNIFGGGNFHVYRSIFRNSSLADINIGDAVHFGFRGNTSIGSKMFLDAGNGYNGNTQRMVLQDNIVLNPQQNAVISLGNMGPLILLDNQFGTNGGPVVIGGSGGLLALDVIALGNKFTVSNWLNVAAAQVRVQNVDNFVVPLSGISTYQPPLPPTPPKLARPVVEVPAGASAAAIQAAVTQAAAYAGQHPVVHLPAGNYALASEIVVPASLDIQFVGDYRATKLNWSGAAGGKMFRLRGPSQATFRNLTLNGGYNADLIFVENADQSGARIFADSTALWGASQHNVFADGLNHATVDLHYCDHRGSTISSIYSKAGSQGVSGSHHIAIWGGMSGADMGAANSNSVLYDVADGGKILSTDIWHEGPTIVSCVNLRGSGMFTLSGGQLAPYPQSPGQYSAQVNNFDGTATFSGLWYRFNRQFLVTGSNPNMKVTVIGGRSDQGPDWFVNQATGGQVSRLNSTYQNSTGADVPVPDLGPADAATLRNAFKLERSTKPRYLNDLGSSVTDVRLYGLFFVSGQSSIHVTATGAVGTPTITSHPSNQTVTEGQTAVFSVVASGTAPLSYQWQKNGVNISGATAASYTTPATGLTDNGTTFRCIVSNSAGSVTSNAATLTVNALVVAPTITTQPASQTVTVGQTATFSVVASGTTPLSYQWQKNGVSISGATAASYTTPATVLSDNGASFRCVVSNSVGSVTSNAATLTVNTQPPPSGNFVAGFTPKTLVGGGGAAYWVGMKFTVGASPLRLTHLGRMMLADNSRTHTLKLMLASNNTDLAGGSVTVNMSGNTVGQFVYAALPTAIALSPNTAYYLVSSEAEGADYFYDWDLTVRTTAVATVNAAVNNGRLFGTTNNSYGPLDFKYTTETVNQPPVITSGPTASPNPATVGQSVAFAAAASDPEGQTLSYQWNFGDGATGNGAAVNHAYTSAGTYTLSLRVSDGVNNVTRSLTLTVNALAVAPAITTQPASKTVTAGQTATFSVVAGGTAPQSYQWQKNGLNITAATAASYTTPATVLADNGASFRCIVSNAAGSVTSNAATLTVNAPPPSVSNFITGFTAKTLVGGGRASYWVGMKFTVGASPLTVAQLGRMMLSGNSRVHTLKLALAANNSDLPGGAVMVNMAGKPMGQFVYASLANPVMLKANTAYYLVSSEVEGADSFYDWDATVRSTAVATVNGGVNNGRIWGSTGNSYGPLDFKYSLPAVGLQAAAASGPEVDEQVIDLGSVRVGQRFRVQLPAPEVMAGVRQTNWKIAEGSAPPKGCRLSRARLTGRVLEPGSYIFGVKITSKSAGSVVQAYQLTIGPAE